MRWLWMGLLLAGCGGEAPVCSNAPLGGGCERVEGTWALETLGTLTKRCGAELFAGPLTLTRAGSQVNGTAGGLKLGGSVFESGDLELYGTELSVSIAGRHVMGQRGAGDQLRGSVTFPSLEDSSCEEHWQFVASRP